MKKKISKLFYPTHYRSEINLNSITLKEMFDTGCFENILKLKLALIRKKNVGVVFCPKNISQLRLTELIEFYFYATKGTIQYQNAFPIPSNQYRPWLRKKQFKGNVTYRLPLRSEGYGLSGRAMNEVEENVSIFYTFKQFSTNSFYSCKT